jgi:hypothetical protein
MAQNKEKITMMEQVRDGKRDDISWGCGWRIYRTYTGSPASNLITLVHYGTNIARIRADGQDAIVGGGAYSATDREGINCLFGVFGVNAHAHIVKFSMTVDGDAKLAYIGRD